MRSQVSDEGEVELKCFWVLEKDLPQMGRPDFPFIGQGKDLGYTGERERGQEERENREGESPGAALPFSSARGSCWSYRWQRRCAHIATLSITNAIGRCRRLGLGAPVRHWRYRQVPPFGRGAWSRPGVRCGQQIPLSGVTRGSSSTMLVRQRCWRCECQGIACGGRRSHRDASTPS
jgi:hypothetical protein